ncbi:MAG: GIY-YIG nuclease family protein [Nitrosomonas sp.]|nr:GIY-YIG nuclease family protein [Nitrosomonas sp.]MCG7757654.1 GIY-YIG nuclease family protein [Nitrosomonas sp.]
MKPFWVYILRCADGSYYTGHTDDLDRRIGQHQAGEYHDGYTAARRPVTLMWSQECTTREEALAAEMQIKGWSRKKKEAMMRGDWKEVSRLARGKSMPTKSAHASTSSARTDLFAASASSGRSEHMAQQAQNDQNSQTVRPESFDYVQDGLVEGCDSDE